jgi:hypothetical protein
MVVRSLYKNVQRQTAIMVCFPRPYGVTFLVAFSYCLFLRLTIAFKRSLQTVAEESALQSQANYLFKISSVYIRLII